MTTTTEIIIRDWRTNEVLHAVQAENMRDAVIQLVQRDANLRGANLRDANLRGANLVGANLERANLRDANLRGANLVGANLERANLERANLRGANLVGANLAAANLRGALFAPLIIYGLRWAVVINGFGQMRIGCQLHTVDRWRGFSDRQIASMDSNALAFWHQHGPMLLALCSSYVHASSEDEQATATA